MVVAVECRRCRVVKGGDAFRPKRRVCRQCLQEQHREWRAADPEATKARDAEQYAKHRERYASHSRAWRERNQEFNAERARLWREANPERQRELNRRWEASHSARRLELQRRWRAANRDKVRAMNRNAANARRARMLGAPICNAPPALIAARWDYFAGKCWMCGNSATAMDHVKPLARGGSHCPSNLRPACKTCNSLKGSKWHGAARLAMFKK